jgi:hypothetical protein
MMGSGRPYQNKDYFKLLLAVLLGGAIYIYFSFVYMSYTETARSTYIQDMYKSFQNSFYDRSDGRPQHSQRVVVTGGLVTYYFFGSFILMKYLNS